MYWMGGMEETQDTAEVKIKKQRKRYDIVKTANCTVCGDLAAEHLHYGGIACYSCRAFFRRTVNSNRPILDCSVSQNCKINKETRKRCQWCRFEKCKLVGMKTTWVLTEDDKTKLSLKRDSSPVAGINIGNLGEPGTGLSVMKEEANDGTISPKSDCSISVKPCPDSSLLSSHLSLTSYSPMSQNLDPFAAHLQSASSSFFTAPPDLGSLTVPNQFFPGQFCSMPDSESSLGASRSMFRSQADPSLPRPRCDPIQSEPGQSGIFPLNINKMQVSLSGATDGVSFTIETHPAAAKQSLPGRSPRTAQDSLYQRHREDPTVQRMRWNIVEDEDTSEAQRLGAFSVQTESGSVSRNQKTHHQQSSRTIFRCVSNDDSGETYSMTSMSPDPAPDLGDPAAKQPCWEQALAPQARQCQPQPGDRAKPQVWRLEAGRGQQGGRLGDFTLQETLFVEQLAAIDERVRYQVPMEQEHVKTFLNTSVSGSPISQVTIMHAYQTCIKRIVRFANSLQDFVELPPDDMQKLLVANTVSIINIRIVRWFHPSSDLKTQLTLCGGNGQHLFREALECGKVSEHGRWRVNYDDVFCSPWCCDSTFEDRYEVLMKEMHKLNFDSTIMVLLSVMCLFDSTKATDLSEVNTIVSHGQKFALLLKRYLLQNSGEDQSEISFPKYQEGLAHLREMSEILINKRLIC